MKEIKINKHTLDINKYISSGIVERCMTGMANAQEVEEFKQLVQEYPELKRAMQLFIQEVDLHIQPNAGPPPSRSWIAIEKDLEEEGPRKKNRRDNFIAVDSQSNVHIRVHKYWRYIFITVFILSKIFLILAIYYFIKYNAAIRETERLQHKQEQVK